MADTLVYALPTHLQPMVRVGSRVIVPLGSKKTYSGIVLRLHDDKPKGGFAIKEVISLPDDGEPIILPQQLTLWQWMADYYLCALGQVCKAALPVGLKATTKPRRRKAVATDSLPQPIALPPNGLSEAQRRAMDEVTDSFRDKQVCLLHGITGSGKTEIYIHLIAEALTRGHQVLYLLPEIVLTAQLVERLSHVFGPRLGVYHSKLTEAERTALWRRQLGAQPYDIIIGVRSSVFLPFQRLGLIIVDEEHETSFKQQDPAPRYHARNVALMLARQAGAKTLLGTATPSIETYRLALCGRYGLARLMERYKQVSLPVIKMVDVKELRRKRLMAGPFSPPLLAAMRDALERHEQIILFQNRRGYAPFVECPQCAWVPRCQYCDVSLTLHRATGRMVCHYCGSSYAIPSECPSCGDTRLAGRGYGTERIEDTIKKCFPEARVARMDQDTTRTRQAYEQIIGDFERGETDILVGTQMVAKGLDIDRVTVVGILDADSMMNQPDFRAHERAFQLMEQVSGRAGRRQTQGLVILQTRGAGDELLEQVRNNDFTAFFKSQIEEREAFLYPPFCRLIDIYVKHRDAAIADHLAQDLATALRRSFAHRLLGPDVPPVGRVHLFSIRKLTLKIEPQLSLSAVHSTLRQMQTHFLSRMEYASAQFYYDVDPY